MSRTYSNNQKSNSPVKIKQSNRRLDIHYLQFSDSGQKYILVDDFFTYNQVNDFPVVSCL